MQSQCDCAGWLGGEERAGRCTSRGGEGRGEGEGRERKEKKERGERRERGEDERKGEGKWREGEGGKAYTQLGEYTIGCQKDIVYIPYRHQHNYQTYPN